VDKNSKIFIAGIAGMVGSALFRRLKTAGYTNIHGSYRCRKPASDNGFEIDPQCLVNIDLRRQADVESFFEKEKPEYVFLAAAKVGGILANNTLKADFIYDNLVIAANVIRASFTYGVRKLLNLGSSCIYPKFASQPMKEETLLTGSLEPTNEPYAIAKISAIKLCRYFNEQYKTNYISVMPTNLYGPNDNFDLETSHVLPALIRKFYLANLLFQIEQKGLNENALIQDIRNVNFGYNIKFESGEERFELILSALEKIGITADSVTIWGSGEARREFLYVDDLADACVFLMQRFGFKEIREFINIGVGKDIRIIELAQLIQRIIGFRGKILCDVSKPEGSPRKLLDISRILSLGWQPQTSLEDGIRKTINWHFSKSQRR